MSTTPERDQALELPVTELLCSFAAQIQPNDIPDTVKDTLRLFLLDYFAAIFAGSHVNRAFNDAVRALLLEEGGMEQSTAYFCSPKIPAANAAFFNACLAHGADMDDGNKQAMGHIGASVLSAVFALAELRGCTEEEIVTACVVGYEVFCRLAAAVQPGMIERGFHATGVAGAVAVACSCAKLLKLDRDGIYQAVALSATQASGLLVVTESGQAVKPLNPANAARCGLVSALLAEKGVRGSLRPLESSKGWCHAVSAGFDSHYLTDGLGTRFAICDCYIKPYPSCRHTHCVIEAAVQLHPLVGSRLEEIDHIDMFLYEAALKVASVVIPENDDQTKFSVYYAFSRALQKGSFGFADLNMDALTEETLTVIRKVRYIPDPTLENRAEGIRGTRIVVHFLDGSAVSTEVLRPRGDPENPLTFADVSEKLFACAVNAEGGMLAELIRRVWKFGAPVRFLPFSLSS